MGVLDGVDVAAALLACADQSGQTEFAQMLAHGGHADAGAFCQGVTSWISWAASHSTCSRVGLLSSVNVAAAEANCGWVGLARETPGVVSGRRTFWFAMAASILTHW